MLHEDAITSQRSYIQKRPANINRRAHTPQFPFGKEIDHSENAPSRKITDLVSSRYEENQVRRTGADKRP